MVFLHREAADGRTGRVRLRVRDEARSFGAWMLCDVEFAATGLWVDPEATAAELGCDGEVICALCGGGRETAHAEVGCADLVEAAGLLVVVVRNWAVAVIAQVVHVDAHGDGGLAVLAGGLVAYVLFAVLNPNKKPAHAAPERLDHVPDVGRVPEGLDAHEAACLGLMLVLARWHARESGDGVKCRFGVVGIGAVGEGPEVENGEESHLEAKEEGRYANLQVWVGDHLGGMDDLECGGADTDGCCLPEGEKDN